MKNIIPWEHPTDAKFVSRFANRVSVVSQPIIARRKWDRHLSEQRSRFAGLPIVERFESITSACRDLLEENGLHEVGYGVPGYRGGTYSRLSSSSVVKWVGVRNSKSLAESVLIVVDARIGSRLLKDVRNLQGFPEYDLYSIVRRDLLCNWVEERCEQLKWMGPSAT